MRVADFVLVAALCSCTSGVAQTLHIENGNVSYNFAAATAGEMTFGVDNTLNAGGRDFVLTESSNMWVDGVETETNVVEVTFDGSRARVDISGDIARYVDATVDGAHVTVTQSADVSEDTCGEITYRLSGRSDNGSLSLAGSYKASIELLGLTLTNPSGAALDIQNSKRISLSVKSGTVNELADGASGSQKGCVACKGHLEIKGKGTLTVSGNASHAIYAKEYVEMKNCTVNVVSAVKDGINCSQYFLLESGVLNIHGIGDDGVQVSYKDDADRETEDTGSVTIVGGTVNIAVTAAAAKGIKCEGDMLVSGGELTVSVSGDGVWDSEKNKTKASACLGADGNMTISGGEFDFTATGGGGKGINCDGNLTVNGGKISITTSGGIVAYVNNVLSTDYRGNTDRLDSDMKSSPKGIKADGDININGGEITVTTTGNGAEGIESKSVLTISDGTVYVVSTDDAINSSSHMHIKGGNVTVIVSGNDGLDSNGNMYIEGGYIMAFGSRSPECGIDANEEEGYSVVFSGGTLLAVGGGNSVPSASSGSTQPYVTGSGTVTAGSEIELTDSADTTLASFTVPAAYTQSSGTATGPGGRPGGGVPGGNGNSVLVTCPGLTSGSSYTLKFGASTSSVTARLTGNSSGPGRPF